MFPLLSGYLVGSKSWPGSGYCFRYERRYCWTDGPLLQTDRHWYCCV